MLDRDDGESLDVLGTIGNALAYCDDQSIAEAGFGGASTTLEVDQIAEVVKGWAVSPEGCWSVQLYALARLVDDRYAAVMAWADTTGWGCQNQLIVKIAPTMDGAIRALDTEGRFRLGLEIS